MWLNIEIKNETPRKLTESSVPNTGTGRNPRMITKSPCENCQNNPLVNPYASGICDCTLPDAYYPLT
jgi:hypothetical protein